MDGDQRDTSQMQRGFATRSVHTGERMPAGRFIPAVAPIYASNSFVYDDIADLDTALGGEEGGYAYTRHGNPTTRSLELAIASLEGTENAIVFASGMAALHAAILNEIKAGSRIVAAADLYGATRALLSTVFASLDVETTYIDILDLAVLQSAVETAKPRVVLFETISNPLLHVADIAAIVEIAHANRAVVICDNTFATPFLVNPVRFGVDIVVHSTTKYLGGHGDVTGGAVATTADRVSELNEIGKLVGGILGPFEAWLTLRGLKTLPLRMRQQCENASGIANFLHQHPRIATVYFPGSGNLGERESVFNSNLRGAMVSFDIAGADREIACNFLAALQLIVPATTLGDVYTLALYPPMSSHRALDADDLAAIGIGPGLIRLSAGIEDLPDILADLDQALAVIAP